MMSESLSIRRPAGKGDGDHFIHMDEWKSAIEQVKDVRLCERAEPVTNPRTGEQVLVPLEEGDAEIYLPVDGKWYRVLSYHHGSISFKWTPSFENPEDHMRKTVMTLARILGAGLVDPGDKPYGSPDSDGATSDKPSDDSFEEETDDPTGMKIAGELVYELGSLRFSSLNATMLKLLARLPKEEFSLESRSISAEDLCRFLEDERVSWTTIEAGQWRFLPATGVKKHRLDSLHFEGIFDSQTDAVAFLEEFIDLGNFVHARLYDAEYNHWQNEQQLEMFTSSGKPVRGLKVMTNTLGWRVVDVSKNLGRRIMQEGYIDAIGSVMWFGAGFWRALGRPMPDLRDLGKLTSLNDSVNRLTLHAKPFTSNEGEEESVQKLAWRMIFGM